MKNFRKVINPETKVQEVVFDTPITNIQTKVLTLKNERQTPYILANFQGKSSGYAVRMYVNQLPYIGVDVALDESGVPVITPEGHVVLQTPFTGDLSIAAHPYTKDNGEVVTRYTAYLDGAIESSIEDFNWLMSLTEESNTASIENL